MNEFKHAKDATKEIDIAVPTVASDGSVIRWEITFSYTKGDVVKTYNQEIFWMEEGEEMFQPKPPKDFTIEELTSLLPLDAWDGIFHSQYESLHPQTDNLNIKIDKEFDIKKLKQ